jgi:hypothetical protein
MSSFYLTQELEPVVGVSIIVACVEHEVSAYSEADQRLFLDLPSMNNVKHSSHRVWINIGGIVSY